MSYHKTLVRHFRWTANTVVWLHMGERVYEAVARFGRWFSQPGRWSFLVRSGRLVRPEPRNVYATLEAARRARWEMRVRRGWTPAIPVTFDPSLLGATVERKIIRLRDEERAAWTREPAVVTDEGRDGRLLLTVDVAPTAPREEERAKVDEA